ncbi:TRAP transporter small permease [Rhizobium sp. NRK18]|uniref:TRAP transporter small permease n=1 Tax=Rhizobium sp. NRK18 TaxID=2964667 RepID=UPI0021C2A928|nr:TRAP transporter small permease [Rhizobium sp. NRK18]MCQ2006157.1 TRAP transporter small permease [Rhizobium sp. NRK18]
MTHRVALIGRRGSILREEAQLMSLSSAGFSRLLERYFRLLLVIPILALVAMMLTTVADVFMRYVFNAPIRGSYDTVEICLLVSIYFALPAVILEGHQIVIDLIDGLVPARLVKVMKSVAAIAAVVVLCFIFWSMLKPARDAYDFGDMKLELNFPVWIIWVMALFGLFNSIIAAIAVLFGAGTPDTGSVEAEGAL